MFFKSMDIVYHKQMYFFLILFSHTIIPSAGMKVAYKVFPEGLFTGTPPVVVTETPRTNRKPEMANRDKFTDEDLEKIGIYLDNALCDKSSGSKSFKMNSVDKRNIWIENLMCLLKKQANCIFCKKQRYETNVAYAN